MVFTYQLSTEANPIVKTISVVMSPPKMGFSDGSVSPPQPHVVLVTLIVK